MARASSHRRRPLSRSFRTIAPRSTTLRRVTMKTPSLALSLPLIAAASPTVFAQDAVPAAGRPEPRSVLPKQESVETKQVPDEAKPTSDSAATAGEKNGDNSRPPEPMTTPSLPRGSAASVVVGDLGTVEGPVAGTLIESDGLGYDAWQGADRATIEAMLSAVPAATPSATARLLLRKLLLTAAPPPAGRAG